MKRLRKRHVDILIIALLVICLIILVSVVVNKITATNTKVDMGDPKEDGLLNFSGVGIFFEEYTGDFKASEVAKKLEEVTTIYLPELINTVGDYKEIQLIKYFYQNEKDIKEIYGIKDYEAFINFIKKINESGVDVNDWYRLDMDTETFLNESDKKGYSYIEYSVSMKNEQKLNFSLYVAQSSKKSIPYIIDVIKK